MTHPIEDFGEMLSYLEGILGHRFPRSHFVRGNLAKVIATPTEHRGQIGDPYAGAQPDPGNFSRKCNGQRPVSNFELARLIEHFQLAPTFDHELFLGGLERFKDQLKAERIGTHAGSSDDVARCDLLRMAKGDGDRTLPRLFLQITSDLTQRGGIGGDPASSALAFRAGQRVWLDLELPAPGHVVILNDQIDVEITCLVPSRFGTAEQHSMGPLTLPDTDAPYFSVGGPLGNYRLYAIWSEAQLTLPWSGRANDWDDPIGLRSRELGQFVEQLRTLTPRSRAVAAHDYQIVP
ncbi:MAG: hypothetical protein AAFY84_18280 [Pseudomonadota bacterium]